ncbi:MAG: TolC family protein [Dechloromonas sp.]|nr:TolC family protein [Dechloromonas sp.]
MMRRTKLLFIGLACLGGSLQAQPAYDLAQLERLALESSRAVLAAREQLNAARSAVDSAAAFPNPEIEYLSGTLRSRGVGGNLGDARSASLTQPLDLPWLRSARIGAAEAGLAATDAAVRAFEAQLLAGVRLRHYDVLRRQAELKNAREDAALMEGVRARIALRVELGEAPRFELIKADAEMLNAQKAVQVAEFRVGQAGAQLRQLVGAALPADFMLKGQLRDVPAVPPADVVRRSLPGISPDLARARAETVRAERLLDYEKQQRWPRLALKASVSEEPDTRSSQFGVVVSVPLWDRRRGPVGEAAAQLARARHELAAQEFSLDQQLDIAYQQYEIAQAQVAALESGIVRQAEAALKVAEAAYKFGERGFLEVLDAQRVFRAARGELIAARYELAAAWVEIERLRAVPEGQAQ